MDGAPRRGLPRRGRGRRGAPRQGARAGGAGGGGAARGGGRHGGRGGGRAGNGGRAEGGGGSQRPRPRAATPPLRDWFANMKFVNRKRLSLEDFEANLDAFLADHPRVPSQELAVYHIQGHLLGQEAEGVRLIHDVDDGFHKMAITRKVLLKMNLDGRLNSPGYHYWRKSLGSQMRTLETTLDKFEAMQLDHVALPRVFLNPPTLLPKQKKK